MLQCWRNAREDGLCLEMGSAFAKKPHPEAFSFLKATGSSFGVFKGSTVYNSEYDGFILYSDNNIR